MRDRHLATLPWSPLWGWTLASLLAFGCAHGSESNQETFCDPDASIFCRCPGGAPGSKVCGAAGDRFGDCGPCEPRPSSTSSSGSSGGGFGSSSSGAAGMGAGAAGAGGPGGGAQGGSTTGVEPLLATCDEDGDCQTGMCRFRACTKPCTWVSDCPYPASECVVYEPGLTICMPTCQTAVDCSSYQAPPSLCGFTKAIDNWDVIVCADWGSAHQLMPVGSDCLPFDHPACNFGYQERELVCSAQGVCAVGCYVNGDCPAGQSCNGGGSLGTCS